MFLPSESFHSEWEQEALKWMAVPQVRGLDMGLCGKKRSLPVIAAVGTQENFTEEVASEYAPGP